MSAGRTALIAIDWGTTALRGARLDAQGQVLEAAAFTRGILSVGAGEFPAVFAECFGAWRRDSDAPCLIAGMAGSRQGWAEAPYCPCPAGLNELVAKLHWLEPGRLAIVPGLSTEAEGAPDVMRGEEVQILGALRLLGLERGLFVLPGTHSKWAMVRDGRIQGFRTYMTGECYALLSQHSLLARSLEREAPFDGEAFDRGVRHALASASLLHAAFSTRTLSLFGRMAAPALASYLSGVVIGEELRARPAVDGPLVLIGSDTLTHHYRRALALCGVEATVLPHQATWAGLHAVAQHLSLIPHP